VEVASCCQRVYLRKDAMPVALIRTSKKMIECLEPILRV
jgi:hypothetical protein